jgi:hypothetical protein
MQTALNKETVRIMNSCATAECVIVLAVADWPYTERLKSCLKSQLLGTKR